MPGDVDIFRFDVWTEVEIALRLVLAAVLGAAIGFEREQSDKPAGLRTLALVSSGAATFTIVSLLGFPEGDPTRIASNIATGVGFIGAGVILREGADVRGVTTAATIWAVAAVGVLAGTGMYVLALVASVLLFIILRLFPKLR